MSEKRPVQYQTTHCNNANSFVGVHMEYGQTILGKTKGLPEDAGQQGNILFMCRPDNPNSGLQIYYEYNGGIWLRNATNVDIHAETGWGYWKKVTVDASLPVDLPLINDISTSNKAGIFRTDGSTIGLPENLTDKHGIIHSYIQQKSTGMGYQMWVGSGGNAKGKIYVRAIVSNSGQEWVELYNNAKYMTTPEDTIQVNDLNNITKSGIYRTNGTNVQHAPDVTDKWGTVIHMFENIGDSSNGNKKSAIQLFFAIHDGKNRLMWIRRQKLDQWSSWVLLGNNSGGGGIPVLPDEYFPSTDEQPITDANGFTRNGFKRTTTATSDLPTELDEAGKEGVIQFIQEHADGTGTGIQYYVPVQGKYAGTTFTRVRQDIVQVTRSGERQQGIQWSSWKSDQYAKIKIYNTRDTQVDNPYTFRQHADSQAGYIRHDWKFTSIGGLKLPETEKGERCMLSTYVPEPSSVSSNDFSDIFQIAYVIDGKIFKRQGSKTEDRWEEWQQISAGTGGTPTTFDINAELTTEIGKWISGQKETSKAKYVEFHKKELIAMFDSWYKM